MCILGKYKYRVYASDGFREVIRPDIDKGFIEEDKAIAFAKKLDRDFVEVVSTSDHNIIYKKYKEKTCQKLSSEVKR